MNIKFQSPTNGYEVTDGGPFSWLWSLVFGGFYFAFRGNWGWFFIYGLLAIGTFGLSALVVPFFTYQINRTHLLRNGYVRQS